MSWLEDLATKIEALKDEDFNREYVTSAKRGYLTGNPPAATVEVEINVPYFPRNHFVVGVGGVNAKPIGPAPAGCVMLMGFSSDAHSTFASFIVRRSIPWNHGLPIDAAGRKPYPEVDFSTLPG